MQRRTDRCPSRVYAEAFPSNNEMITVPESKWKHYELPHSTKSKIRKEFHVKKKCATISTGNHYQLGSDCNRLAVEPCQLWLWIEYQRLAVAL
jgi:hypothetical protein